MATKKEPAKKAPAKGVSKTPAAAAKPAPKAMVAAKAVVKPAVKPAAKPVAKTVAKTAAKPVVKPAAKTVAKTAAKTEVKAAPKPVVKTAAKTEVKTAAKTAAKPVTKPVAKPAAKSAAATNSKSAAPAKAAPVAKPEPKQLKAKPAPGDPPIVPKKGPIDLSQHKSVAEAAAAVANARGGTGEYMMINGRRVRAISTKGIVIAKKSKSAATVLVVPPNEQEIREIKTKLSKKELDEYRLLLHAKRRQLIGMLNGMEDEALRSSDGSLTGVPVHMADMGSDVYEQDFTLGMAETERAIVNEIDAALQRIEDKTFGVCQMTGKPIAKARLDAKPWAKYTIEAERIIEANGGR